EQVHKANKKPGRCRASICAKLRPARLLRGCRRRCLAATLLLGEVRADCLDHLSGEIAHDAVAPDFGGTQHLAGNERSLGNDLLTGLGGIERVDSVQLFDGKDRKSTRLNSSHVK